MSFTPEELEALSKLMASQTKEIAEQRPAKKKMDPKQVMAWVAVASFVFGAMQFLWGKAEAIATADETKEVVAALKEGFEAEGDIPAQIGEQRQIIDQLSILVTENSFNARRDRIENQLERCKQLRRQATRDSTPFARDCDQEHRDSTVVLLRERRAN